MAAMKESGFSLIELMIVVVVIGILVTMALPMYQGYQAEARTGVMRDNIQSIHMMQVERKLSFGEYVAGNYTPGGPTNLTDRLGWAPNTASDEITYVVTCDTDGSKKGECAANSGYSVMATHASAPGESVTIRY